MSQVWIIAVSVICAMSVTMLYWHLYRKLKDTEQDLQLSRRSCVTFGDMFLQKDARIVELEEVIDTLNNVIEEQAIGIVNLELRVSKLRKTQKTGTIQMCMLMGQVERLRKGALAS